jgi:hypothetical protein
MNLVRLAILAALLGAAAWLASTLSGTPLVGYDDANVFFVYARNLVDGHGFVFNAGGERVEGFTSLSWLLICAAARAITPRFEILLFAVNVACVSVALWWVHRLIANRSAFAKAPAGQAAAFVLVVAVALAPGFVVWNVISLMDSGLWSAVFIITTVVVLRPAFDPRHDETRRLLPVLLIVLVLTRPESLLLGPALIAASILIHRSVKSHVASIVAFAAATAAVAAWRLSYFGYPLPNTYYARAEPLDARITAGLAYFSDFAQANPLVPLALVAGFITAGVAHRRYRAAKDEEARALFGAQSALLVLMVIGCVIPIIDGGDRFGFSRMFQPVVPLAAIQAAITAAAVRLPTHAVTACVVAILLALVPWRHWMVLDELDYASPTTASASWYTPRVEISAADDMRRIGAAFSRAFPDVKPTVGVIVAGGFALTYTGPTIDLMGHNHVGMAHAPGPRTGPRAETAFQPEVFMTIAPDALLLSRWSPERDWFAFPMLGGDYDRPAHQTPDYFERRAASMRIFDLGVMKGLLLRSAAGQHYTWASVRPRGGDRWIHAIFKRDFLKQLEGLNYEIALPTPAARAVP